jgi:hypothetical protein
LQFLKFFFAIKNCQKSIKFTGISLGRVPDRLALAGQWGRREAVEDGDAGLVLALDEEA